MSLSETTKAVDVLEMVKSLFCQKKTFTEKKSFILFAQMELLRCLVIHRV
jgi:hypothetical protein